MHVNRRHKKIACPECEKCFVKQADCDNHFRDVHKFVCRVKRCSVYKYNDIELHEHMRYDHWSGLFLGVINVLKFSALGQNCTSTTKWTTAGSSLLMCRERNILA